MQTGAATVVVRHTANQGVVAGLLGCLFGILGIFTFGIIFVPLAAICSLFGFVRGAAGPSISGVGCSLLAGVLTIWGFIVSPSLWVLTGAAILASHTPATKGAEQHPTSMAPKAAQQIPAASPAASPLTAERDLKSSTSELSPGMKQGDPGTWVRGWPDVGGWHVGLLPMGNSRPMCVAAWPNDNRTGSTFASFQVTAAWNHLSFVPPRGIAIQTPATITVAVDNSPAEQFTLVNTFATGAGQSGYIFDLKDHVNRLLAEMVAGRVLSVTIGGRAYQIPLFNFRSVAAQMGECASLAQRITNGLPAGSPR